MIVGEIANRFAAQLAKEIDWELIADMLVADGWTKAEIVPFSRPELQRCVLEWVRTNVQGHYQNFETQYVFQNEKDALMFMLKWS